MINKLRQQYLYSFSNRKPSWQVAKEIRESLTEEDRQWPPKNGAMNHDYYVYGTPKAEP